MIAERFPGFHICATIGEALDGADILIIASNHSGLAEYLPPEIAKARLHLREDGSESDAERILAWMGGGFPNQGMPDAKGRAG